MSTEMSNMRKLSMDELNEVNGGIIYDTDKKADEMFPDRHRQHCRACAAILHFECGYEGYDSRTGGTHLCQLFSCPRCKSRFTLTQDGHWITV